MQGTEITLWWEENGLEPGLASGISDPHNAEEARPLISEAEP